MCNTPSIPQDRSAEIAAQSAAQRESQVRAGQQNIDSAFGKFDDNFFNDFTKAYENNYNPQVDTQFDRAKTNLRYDNARKGMLDSTPAIFSNDLLNEKYGQQRQQVASDAIGATSNLRNNVSNQKTQLYQLNSSAADPTLASTNAAAAAGTIPNQPQYSALGDLFGGLVNSGASFMAGQNQNNPYFKPNQPLPGGRLPSGGGSGRVVN